MTLVFNKDTECVYFDCINYKVRSQYHLYGLVSVRQSVMTSQHNFRHW